MSLDPFTSATIGRPLNYVNSEACVDAGRTPMSGGMYDFVSHTQVVVTHLAEGGALACESHGGNPTYVRRRDSPTWSRIGKGETQMLEDGDRIRLSRDERTVLSVHLHTPPPPPSPPQPPPIDLSDDDSDDAQEVDAWSITGRQAGMTLRVYRLPGDWHMHCNCASPAGCVHVTRAARCEVGIMDDDHMGPDKDRKLEGWQVDGAVVTYDPINPKGVDWYCHNCRMRSCPHTMRAQKIR